jgi:primary-amine oxidase
MRNLKANGCRLWLASLVLPLTLSAQSKVPQHPLDGLTTDEYWTVHDVLQKSGHMTEKTLTSSVLLREPAKDKVLTWKEGDPIPREADVILEDEGKTIEARVDLSGQKLESWNVMPGVQAPIATGEFTALGEVIKKDPRVLAALKARGITDLSTVNCGAGPLSFRVFPEQDGQRIGWGECTDTHGAYHSWGRTIEGIHILANVTTKKVLDVVDTGPVPIPNGPTSFEEADATPRAGYTPMIVMQPMGPGYKINKGDVSWQNWHFRFRLDQRVGAVVNMVRYQDGDRLRSIMYEGSLSEMYVPYMDPEEGWNSRAFLDAGEFLLGGLTKPLGPDDCPETAEYFASYAPSDHAGPIRKPQAACMFERVPDNPAWRHFENNTINGRPSRELVLRTAAVIGNYDYVMDWIFQQDGTIRVAVGATGIVETKSVHETSVPPMHDGDGGINKPSFGTLVAPNTVAVNHDHYFSYRLDLDVDGPNNSLMIDRMVPQQIKARTRTSIWAVESSIAHNEKDGILDIDLRKPAMWNFISSTEHDKLGHSTSYEIMPGATAVSFVSPDDPAQQVGAFSAHQLWVTPYKPDELYAAGMYVTSSKGLEGLPAWTKANRPIENTDIVAWYTLGFHHAVRVEDWPVMPTMWHDFLIRPVNFFNENPVMTLPHKP